MRPLTMQGLTWHQPTPGSHPIWTPTAAGHLHRGQMLSVLARMTRVASLTVVTSPAGPVTRQGLVRGTAVAPPGPRLGHRRMAGDHARFQSEAAASLRRCVLAPGGARTQRRRDAAASL